MGELRSNRLVGGALALLVLSVAGSCKRESRSEAETLTASLMFDNASPDAREALASDVNFRITEANFAQWEKAQRNLEKLPRSAIPSSPGIGRTAVDRAVSRLESSPYARTAIERTGLSVREFVLETIALAQVAEASQTGKSISGARIPDENFQFVQRYTARALYSRSGGAGSTYDWNADAADVNSSQQHLDAQMNVDDPQHGDTLSESQNQQGEMEREDEVEPQPGLPDPPRDSSRQSPRDSVRDSLTTLRR